MAGFAEEVAQSKSAKPAAEVALPTGSNIEGTEAFNEGLETPESAEIVAAKATPVADAAAVVDTETPKAKIRIGTKEFETPEAAYAYAQELEIARAEDKGFIEGVKQATKKDEPEIVVKTPEEELEELFFTDPKAAFKKFNEMIKSQLEGDLTKKDELRAQAEAMAQVRNATWENFYQSNADLVDYQELISGKNHEGGPLLQQWWSEVDKLPLPQAMQIIADKARNALKIQKSKAGTVEELPNKKVTTVTPNGSLEGKVTVSEENNSDEPLDFISQVRKHGKR